MGGIVTSLFGGGEKEKKVPPPREDEAAKAQADARRKLQRGFSQRDTIIGGMYNEGLKTKLGQ